MDDMTAKRLFKTRKSISDAVFFEISIWLVPVPLAGSRHLYKYRLALVSDLQCVLRYDNEVGKGDHKHFGRKQVEYNFKDVDTLLRDFHADVDAWQRKNQT